MMNVVIRERLALYLTGDTTLDEFKEWFFPATWSLEGKQAILTYEIILILAEYPNIGEGKLKRALSDLAF